MKKLLTSILFALWATVATAAWPTKPITVIVPYPAGAWGDSLARIFQPELEDQLKVPVVIKFMPGAANSVAINHVLTEDNDDHTFLQINDDFITAQYVVGTKLYEKFTPVTIWATYPFVIYGGPNSSTDKFKQQIQRGETVNIGNLGIGGAMHLWTANVKSTLTFNPVPYKGAAPLLVDVLGGHIEYGMGNLVTSQAQQFLEEGKIHTIMVTTPNRHPLYKNVPTYRELGFKGDPLVGWLGFVARKDTSTEAIEKMSTALRNVVQNHPKIQEEVKRGVIPINLNVQESQKLFNDAVRKTETIKITK